jgi:hypothetical protein
MPRKWKTKADCGQKQGETPAGKQNQADQRQSRTMREESTGQKPTILKIIECQLKARLF